ATPLAKAQPNCRSRLQINGSPNATYYGLPPNPGALSAKQRRAWRNEFFTNAHAFNARFVPVVIFVPHPTVLVAKGLRTYAAPNAILTACAVRRAHRIPPDPSPGPRGVRARESEMPARTECGFHRRRAAVALS